MMETADRDLLSRWYAAVKRRSKADVAFDPFTNAAEKVAYERCARLFGQAWDDMSHPDRPKMHKVYAEFCLEELERVGEPARVAFNENFAADAAYKELAAEIRATSMQSPIGLAVFALLAWNEHADLWGQPRDKLDHEDGAVRDLIERVLEYAGLSLPEPEWALWSGAWPSPGDDR
jgi:hypothetical protein